MSNIASVISGTCYPTKNVGTATIAYNAIFLKLIGMPNIKNSGESDTRTSVTVALDKFM